MIQIFLSSDLAWRLGWTLLHSVWQIAALGGVVGLTLSLSTRTSANVRYAVACCGMAAMLVPLVTTFVLVARRPMDVALVEQGQRAQVTYPGNEKTVLPPPRQQLTTPPISRSLDSAPSTSQHNAKSAAQTAWQGVDSWNEFISPGLPWVVAAWLLGVVLLGIWNIVGWLLIQRIKCLATTPTSESAQRRLAEFARQLRLSVPVQLVESLLVETPAVIGWLRPVILLPVSLTTTLSAAELDAVLAHELIHIRRRDYLVNLLQALVETLVFYHPCVWWLSRRIRIEREFCCDDAAVVLCGAKSGYVSALAAIERGRFAPVPALAFSGGSTNLTLLRIRRLLGSSPSVGRSWPGGVSAAILPLFVVAFLGAALTQTGRLAARAEDPSRKRAQQTESIEPKAEQSASSNPQATENVDLKQFRLILSYHGEADKPFYNVTFSVPPLAHRASPFSPLVMIDEQQAAKIVEQLSASGFFRHAKLGGNQDDPTTGPQYLLRVRTGDRNYEESLGWDIGTIATLDGIRKALDGDTAKAMDQLLERLAGQRKIWQEGQVVNDLKTTLSMEKTSFEAGQPIPIKLQVANVGSIERTYGQHLLSHSDDMVVIDERCRRVPYVAGPSQLQESQKAISPGEMNDVEAFDLSEVYYLRRPGRYTIAYRGPSMPSSNSLTIDVTPDAAGVADGDPIGRLLPLVHGTWVLEGNPNSTGRVNPGNNYSEVPGRTVHFLDNPTGYKKDLALVWVWLTDEAAVSREAPADTHFPPSEYLGVAGRWHVYVHAPDEALKRWPSLKEVLKEALDTEARAADAKSPAEPKWGEARHGLQTRLAVQKRTFDAGEPIPMKLEIRNVSGQVQEYRIPPDLIDERLSAVDSRGNRAFALGGFAHITVAPYRTIMLNPGKTVELESFDLADAYYLRQPGRYTVLFTGEPASAPFEFDVAVNPVLAVADGDPVGRLLPLVKKGWWLGAGPGKPVKFQPGSNHAETTGRAMTFVFNGPKWKEDAGLINLWLANKPAPEQPVRIESSLPQTEYLGKLSRWHVYYLASEKALAAWPTAKQEIQQALSAESKVSLQIDVKRNTFAAHEDIRIGLTIHNAGSQNLDAPSTYWSAVLVLDGKEHKRVPELASAWNGPGTIIPGGDYSGAGTEISEYGIVPGSLKPGRHTIAVQIGSEKSNELAIQVGEMAASATDSIRVVLPAKTLEYTLNGQSKPAEHRPRPGHISPDGKWIIDEIEAGVVRRLTVGPVAGGVARPLPGPGGNEFSWCWSPDSKRIAYVAWESGKGQIHLIDVDGSNDEQVTDGEFGASAPNFGPDGSLAYLVWRGPLGKGRHSDLVVRRFKEVKTILGNQYIGGFQWSPDGKSLAINKMGELIFYDFDEKNDQQSIQLKNIDPGLSGHMAHHVTWSPEGDRVACCLFFVGGRTKGPRMPGDDEVFIIPRNGKPHSFSISPKNNNDAADSDGFPLIVMGLEWVRS